MLRTIVFLLLCSFAQASTYTATQSGNWAATSTWGGSGPPGTGDRAIINCACTVTIPVSTTVVIGDSPVAGTAVVSVGQATNLVSPKLVNAGTLTLQGDLSVGPGAWNAVTTPGTYEMQGGSITQFSSPSTVAYRLTWPAENNNPRFPLIKSTATSWASPAIVQNISGNVGNNGMISTVCCDSSLNLSYTKLINLGTSSVPGLKVGGDLILNHVLMVGSGNITHLGTGAYQACIDNLDVRSPTASQLITVPGPPAVTGCNHINNSTFYSNASGTTADLEWPGMTVTNTIFGIGSTWPNANNVTWTNVVLADPFGTPNNSPASSIQTGFLWDGGGAWISTAAYNAHTLNGVSGTNAVQNIVIDGSGSTNGIGDLWVTPGVHYVNRVMMVNGAGNLEDGTGTNSTSFGFINHSTSEDSDGGGGASTISLNEFQANQNQLKQATNILADRNFNGLCPASSAAPYIQQTGLTYDYNWFSNRKDPDPVNVVSVRPWNSATNHQGSLCDNWISGSGSGGADISKATISVTTVTDAAHLIVSSTTSVSVGDYLYHASSGRGAFVTAVPSSGHVTIGFDEDGVSGIPSAIAGQSLVVLPNIWSSGVFGDSGKGQHEGYTDPRLINPNVTVATWDKANGGPGTLANARLEAFKMNGWDVDGNAVTFNPAYSIANWLAYIRQGLMPTNLAMKGFSSDAAWAPTTAYVVGQSIQDSALHLQICTHLGTSGSSVSFNDLGGTTTDGTVTWTDQGIINNPGAVAIQIYNSPGISGGSVN
jgi:hypothetical protein